MGAREILQWSGVVAFCLAFPTHGYEFRLDRFAIATPTAILFDDQFSDGFPPPSGPQGAATYFTAFVPSLGTEVGGKLILNGSDAQPSAVFPFTFETATRQTFLSAGGAFTVAGLFDLIAPLERSEGYAIRVTDQTAAVVGNDDVRLGVFRTMAGQVAVSLVDVNNTAGIFNILGNDLLDASDLSNSQIILALDVSQTGVVSGRYAFPGGTFIDIPGTATIYNGETFTRAGFVVTTPIPAPPTVWLIVVAVGALWYARRKKHS